MNSNVSTFIASARDVGFTVRYRDRDGKDTFTFSVAGNSPDPSEVGELNKLAFNAGMKLTFGKDNGEYVNARGEVTTGTVAVEADEDGNLPRLPDFQWALVKDLKRTTFARDRLNRVINSGNVFGKELDLLVEQKEALETYADVLLRRVNFYGLAAYL